MEIYFDGACAPFNPGGITTYGYVLLKELVEPLVLGETPSRCMEEGYGRAAEPGTPLATNNVAEYTGLIKGLDAVRRYVKPGEPIKVYGDSQLAIKQVTGVYDVKAEHLKPLVKEAQALVAKLISEGHTVTLEWIPREKNGHADRLSKEAIKYARHDKSYLDDVMVGFGSYKGVKYKDLPLHYVKWLWDKHEEH